VHRVIAVAPVESPPAVPADVATADSAG
jgi:hypothetical protein